MIPARIDYLRESALTRAGGDLLASLLIHDRDRQSQVKGGLADAPTCRFAFAGHPG